MELTTLTDEDLDQLRVDVRTEQERRVTLVTGPETVAAINEKFLAAEGTKQGQPWRQPAGAHDAYPKGWQVQHDGKTWESLNPANVWEPGQSGWREVTAGDEPAAWVQPTGSHDAYPVGAVVTHNGQTWVSDQDGNVWVPGDYGWTAQ